MLNSRLSSLLRNELLEGWNSEYPSVLQHHSNSFEQHLQSLINLQHTFVTDDDHNFYTWYFEFDRENKKQFGIIVHPNYQKRGLAKAILDRAKLNKDNSLLGLLTQTVLGKVTKVNIGLL